VKIQFIPSWFVYIRRICINKSHFFLIHNHKFPHIHLLFPLNSPHSSFLSKYTSFIYIYFSFASPLSTFVSFVHIYLHLHWKKYGKSCTIKKIEKKAWLIEFQENDKRKHIKSRKNFWKFERWKWSKSTICFAYNHQFLNK